MKRYYIEYSWPCGWGVMLKASIVHAKNLRAVHEKIKDWNMYTQRHKYLSFWRFLWMTYRGYTSIHCLFRVRRKHKKLSDEEILSFYGEHRLQAGFREKL